MLLLYLFEMSMEYNVPSAPAWSLPSVELPTTHRLNARDHAGQELDANSRHPGRLLR